MTFSEYMQAKVMIFTPDGKVFESSALSLEIAFRTEMTQIRSDDPGFFLAYPMSNTIELNATLAAGATIEMMVDDYKEYVERRKRELMESKKFQCEWCGTISTVDHKSCPACGGWRPIFFEVLEVDCEDE